MTRPQFIDVALDLLACIEDETPAGTMRVQAHLALIFLQLHLGTMGQSSATNEAEAHDRDTGNRVLPFRARRPTGTAVR